MTDLNVDPSHLNELANAQRQAAADLKDAPARADDVVRNLWVTHGVYPAQANVAFGKAVTARRTAAEVLESLSASQADNLEHGGAIYVGVDQEQGANIARPGVNAD